MLRNLIIRNKVYFFYVRYVIMNPFLTFISNDSFDRIDFLLEQFFNGIKIFLNNSKDNTKLIIASRYFLNILIMTFLVLRLFYLKFIKQNDRYVIDMDINLKVIFTALDVYAFYLVMQSAYVEEEEKKFVDQTNEIKLN